MAEIRLQAEINKITEVTEFMDAFLEEHDCSMKAQMQLDIVMDELFSNIANYAYPDKVGEAIFRIEMQDDSVVLTYEDWGIPFDPTAKEEADTTKPLEEREIGGLGIHLVRKMTDKMEYEYKDHKNILKVTKKIL